MTTPPKPKGFTPRFIISRTPRGRLRSIAVGLELTPEMLAAGLEPEPTPDTPTAEDDSPPKDEPTR